MLVYKGYEDFTPSKAVVTVGVFDGVHRGHQALLAKIVARANAIRGESVVITFSSHPKIILGLRPVVLLTTHEEKMSLLEKNGIDHVLILDFDPALSRTSACDFIRNIIAGRLKAEYLFFGHDHRIGREGEGDYTTIRNCEGISGMTVEQVKGVFSGSTAISSSAIREALLHGEIERANELLGYNYQLSGTVVKGRMLGRSFGYPTANINPDPEKLIPSNGVYAVETIVSGVKYPGMMSIGTNPTVNPHSSARTIEVHIIDFDRDIYGHRITIRFLKRLRDEKKFPDTNALARQMESDRNATLMLFR